MKYKFNSNYRPFQQLPFCCVPATLQWILYRHQFDIINQELIGKELGLRLPAKARPFFTRHDLKYHSNNAKIQWGTQIFTKNYTINSFFKKYHIPLSISKQYHFYNEQKLHQFLVKNFKRNTDIILRFNNKLIAKNNHGCGHFAIIIQYNDKNKSVIIGDPEPPFYKPITLKEILYSISDKIDKIQRGFFIVKKIK